MALPLTVKTPPTIEPCTLDEVKLHLRVDSNTYSTSLGIPGRVFPAVNQVWPVPAIGIGGAVIIEFVSGATTADLVPDEWKTAIKLGVDSLYENRAQTVIGTRLVAVPLPE